MKPPRTRGLAFVFTGQGAQWYAMGRELIAVYPAFGHSLETTDLCLRELGACWSLLGKFAALTRLPIWKARQEWMLQAAHLEKNWLIVFR